MDLHYDGIGWRALRVILSRSIPADHPLRDAWLGPLSKTVPGKCLLLMSLEEVYRGVSLRLLLSLEDLKLNVRLAFASPLILPGTCQYLYRPFPNMIQYQAADDEL